MQKYKLLKDLPWAEAGIQVQILGDEEKGWFIKEANDEFGSAYVWTGDCDPRESDFFTPVEDEMWRPEDKSDVFYYIRTEGDVGFHHWHDNDEYDQNLFDIGNYFRTKADAELAKDEIKKLLTKLRDEGKVS